MKLLERMRDDRFLLLQVLFIVLFSILMPLMQPDFKMVMKIGRVTPYIALWGYAAILLDAWGSLIKCRAIGARSHSSKRRDWFFGIFWIFRCAPMMFGLMITFLATDGVGEIDDSSWKMWLIIPFALWWLVQGFWCYHVMDTQKKPVPAAKEFAADMALTMASAFMLLGMWFSMDMLPEEWNDMNNSQRTEYLTAGFVLFLMIHVPANIFFYIDGISQVNSKRQNLFFWLGIIVTGYTVLMLPVWL
jgi:hypothetical protein